MLGTLDFCLALIILIEQTTTEDRSENKGGTCLEEDL